MLVSSGTEKTRKQGRKNGIEEKSWENTRECRVRNGKDKGRPHNNAKPPSFPSMSQEERSSCIEQWKRRGR